MSRKLKTGRPRKLDLEGEVQIRLRVAIARETSVISQQAVAEGFELSIMTLRRYAIPKERRASQVLATRKYEERRLLDTSKCAECDQAIYGHVRCLDCTMLLHEEPMVCLCGRQHGKTKGRRCGNCFDRLMQVTFDHS